MPVGSKLGHRDPNWYRKERARVKACERQRAKRERDRAALRQPNCPNFPTTPRVRLTFSRTKRHLIESPEPFGPLGAAITPEDFSFSGSLRVPLLLYDTHLCDSGTLYLRVFLPT